VAGRLLLAQKQKSPFLMVSSSFSVGEPQVMRDSVAHSSHFSHMLRGFILPKAVFGLPEADALAIQRALCIPAPSFPVLRGFPYGPL
jgi:hypothetical protein